MDLEDWLVTKDSNEEGSWTSWLQPLAGLETPLCGFKGYSSSRHPQRLKKRRKSLKVVTIVRVVSILLVLPSHSLQCALMLGSPCCDSLCTCCNERLCRHHSTSVVSRDVEAVERVRGVRWSCKDVRKRKTKQKKKSCIERTQFSITCRSL